MSRGTSTSIRSQNSLQRRSAESRLRQLEAESLQDALPEGFSTSEHKKPLVSRIYHPTAVVTVHLVLGSIFGVLARKGLQTLTGFSGLFLGGVVWANFVACLVMGFAVESQMFWSRLLDEKTLTYASKGAIPAYVGITTGFCGSCSSFSSFVFEIFTKAANLPAPETLAYPNVGYGLLAALEVALAHMGLSIFSLVLGKHAARAVDRKIPSISLATYKSVEILMCFLGIAVSIVVIVLLAAKNNGSWRSWMFSCFFAPFGTISRYWLSRKMNQMVPDFPLGTFTANISASILLAVFNVLVRGRRLSGPIIADMLSCHVLVGLDDGFCGCLSTVSTFVVELLALDLVASYTYGSVSIATGFVCVLLIAGSYNWAVGFTSQVC